MTSDVQKILAMLHSEASDRQCAAAMVLGELAPRDGEVVTALGKALGSADLPLKNHILAALQRIRAKEALPFLLPMLRAAPDVRERALGVVAAYGPGVAREFRSMLEHSTQQDRGTIYAALVRVRGRDGLNLLMQGLLEDDADIVEAICGAFEREVPNLDEGERELLRARIEAFLETPRARRSRAATLAGIRLLGALRLPSAQTALLAHAAVHQHPATRAEALRALRQLGLNGPATAELAKHLLDALDDRDFTGVVAPAIEILTPLALPDAFIDRLLQLSKNGWTPARRFALRKLREFDTPRVAKALMEFLESGDPPIRDLAAESLCYLHSARPMLFERFLKEESLDLAWVLSRTLRPHGIKLKKDQVKRLAERVHELVDRNSPLKDAFLQLLRQIAPEQTLELLLARATKLKEAQRFGEALQCMSLLTESERRAAEVRFQVGVLQLKLSTRANHAEPRSDDPAIVTMHSLLVEDRFPLLARLTAEHVLGPDDYYHLGVAFSDRLNGEAELGRELLRVLAQRYPKDKHAKNVLARLQVSSA
ncbi:MAG: hypothetical protein U1E76_19945 [Planctomycetota bacterium]